MRTLAWSLLWIVVLWLGCRDRTRLQPKRDGSVVSDASVRDEPVTEGSRVAVVQPTVLLISLDGFRWDYLATADAPNLQRFVETGVKATSLVPVFPSKTFPNHYTIVTGLYPENHGIVSNSMFDPVFREVFRMTDARATTDGKWWEGEPIWVTAFRQGQRTATMFWPGSDAAIQGVRPTYYRSYNGRLPHKDRVNQVIKWLTLPKEKRPTFLTLYLEDVDAAGHAHGPDSVNVFSAIKRVDTTLGLLRAELEKRKLLEKINIIVTSDHGMAALSPERRIFLNDYIDLNDTYINEISMVLALNPKEGKLEKVYAALKGKHPHLKVYKKSEVPERLHYRKHRRIAEIVAIADEGWTVVRDRNFSIYSGSHGYDPQIKSMHGIFIASGPAFRRGHSVPSFQNIHLYELMCHILKLKPAKNDGSLEKVKGVLRVEP